MILIKFICCTNNSITLLKMSKLNENPKVKDINEPDVINLKPSTSKKLDPIEEDKNSIDLDYQNSSLEDDVFKENQNKIEKKESDSNVSIASLNKPNENTIRMSRDDYLIKKVEEIKQKHSHYRITIFILSTFTVFLMLAFSITFYYLIECKFI
ncbi:hypothetical protein A0H76_1564 [Hepatospora eriocheir]|uniref:Uncharacterized protein n=1 Tax=Hepatospora eriocheir TaxID=1081669 RepID=A0A1X0Q5Q8_9MICR|nr:hypothetical protein A0H76_1564 [Hepatospora eriocheir]